MVVTDRIKTIEVAKDVFIERKKDQKIYKDKQERDKVRNSISYGKMEVFKNKKKLKDVKSMKIYFNKDTHDQGRAESQ